MIAAEQPRKKRVFIAASSADVAQVRRAMRESDLDGVTLEDDATPGTSWVDSLHRCVTGADVVIGIMGGQRPNTNVFFELGVASALNKPTLLFIAPDYPIDLIPPSGLPYLRMDLQNRDALLFGLQQVASLSSRDVGRRTAASVTTRPIGAFADQLLARLPQADPREFVDLIDAAIKISGVPTIARGDGGQGKGVNFAIWSSDLEPTVANPLLIECKLDMHGQSAVDAAIGRMVRALNPIPNGFGIVLYRDLSEQSEAISPSIPIAFISAAEFFEALRDTGLAEYVRTLRNSAFDRA